MSDEIVDDDPSGPVAGIARPGRWVLALIAAAALIRVPFLFDSVWFDEACVSGQRLGTLEQLVATVYADTHPPLWSLLMHGWFRLFGDSEWVLRLPSLLFGLLTLPLLFYRGRYLVGDRGALWGTALLALSPPHVWCSTDASPHAAMAFFGVAMCMTFAQLMTERRTAWRWLLHVTVVFLALALHYYLAFLAIVLAAAAPLIARGFTRTALNILCWHGLAVMLLGTWLWLKERIGAPMVTEVELRSLTPDAMHDLFYGWGWTGNALQPLGLPGWLAVDLVQWLAIALTGFGIVQVLSRQRERALGVLVPVLALTIPSSLVLMAWGGLGNGYAPRTCLPAIPLLLLLIGAGIRLLPGWIRLPAGALALLVALTSTASMWWHRHEHYAIQRPKADWRAAATWLGSEIDARAAALEPGFVFSSMPNPRPLSYYEPRIQDERALTPPTTTTAIRGAAERALGSWAGDLAADFFERFAAGNAARLANAQLRIRRCERDPTALALPPGDHVCYLVQYRWHPPVTEETAIAALLAHDRVEVLGHESFPGLDVYKVRITQ